MTLRSNGSYIGPRPAGPSAAAASGIWDLRTAERQRRANAWPAIAADANFANVSLLLHMDGSNNSTTFTDSSSNALTVTANGNAKISTAESKFGGASGAFDGTGDYLTVPSNADFDFGTGDFVVECWLYLLAEPDNSNGLAIVHSASQGGFSVGFQNASTLGILRQAVAWDSTVSYTPPLNQWIYIAVARSSGNVRWYINGSQQGSTLSNSENYSQGTSSGVGGNPFYNTSYLNGYMDELRITKGSDRGYTGSTITVPTAAFPDA